MEGQSPSVQRPARVFDDRDVTIDELCEEVWELREQVESYRFCFLQALGVWHEDYAAQQTKIGHMGRDIARLQELVGRIMEGS